MDVLVSVALRFQENFQNIEEVQTNPICFFFQNVEVHSSHNIAI